MSSTGIEVDVAALAREVANQHDRVVPFVIEDLRFGLGNARGNLALAAKYPLKRLRGLDLISEDDEEQLCRLADAVDTGAEVVPLVEELQRHPDASPVAVALADLMRSAAPREAALASVIAGAYFGLSLNLASVRPDGAEPSDQATLPALVGILAASGGALAATALAIARQFEALRPPDTASRPT